QQTTSTVLFFFSSRRRHTRSDRDWSSDVCSSDLMPGFGYGINYEYGLFKQEIENGYQKEKPDHWRAHGSPWLIERPDEACIIPRSEERRVGKECKSRWWRDE